jgi:hypothetical protein
MKIIIIFINGGMFSSTVTQINDIENYIQIRFNGISNAFDKSLIKSISIEILQ